MQSSLRSAIEEGHVGEAARLLREGQSIDWSDESKNDLPFLHTAAARADLPMVRLLLDHGGTAVIDDFDDLGMTALAAAASNGHTEMISELIRHGANVNAIDERQDGDTALLRAINGGHPRAVEALVDAGADPNIMGSRGEDACKFSKDIAAERRNDVSREIVELVHRSPLHGWDHCRFFPELPTAE